MPADAKPVDLSIGVFADDQLLRIQQAYGLETLLVLPFLSLNGEIIDLRRRTETARKVLLNTERGVCFLKELPWYCSSPEFAAFQTHLLVELADRGAAVARPLATTRGDLFFHDPLTGAILLLQPYLEGRSWTRTPAEAREAGNALALLHSLASRVRPLPFVGMRDVFGSAHALVALLLDNWTGPQGAKDDIATLARLSLATVEHCRATAYAVGYGTAVIPVHGDYNPFNLIFETTSDGIAGIIDFDNACLDDRAHDLGESLVRFGWLKYRGLSSAYGDAPSEFDPVAVDAVLHGYRQYDEQTAETVQPVLPTVMTTVALELAAIGLLSGYYTVDDVSKLHHNVKRLLPMAHDAIRSAW